MVANARLSIRFPVAVLEIVPGAEHDLNPIHAPFTSCVGGEGEHCGENVLNGHLDGSPIDPGNHGADDRTPDLPGGEQGLSGRMIHGWMIKKWGRIIKPHLNSGLGDWIRTSVVLLPKQAGRPNCPTPRLAMYSALRTRARDHARVRALPDRLHALILEESLDHAFLLVKIDVLGLLFGLVPLHRDRDRTA